MNHADYPLRKAVDAAIDEALRDVVVGVSGGADSVALLRALASPRRKPLRLVVAHLDHELRPRSGDDARWVRQLAEQGGLEVVIERQDVATAAASTGRSLEEAARDCRYAFLARVASQHGCPSIAVAHTADDQAETVLHQLLRGTGLPGLRGMTSTRPLGEATLLRPLLSVSRRDVLDYLAGIDQSFLTDETNDDPTFTRNRLRHLLLPLLREDYNPQIELALSRLARQASDAQELIDDLADALLTRALRETTPRQAQCDVAPLRSAHRHLVREAMRRLFIRQNWSRQRMGFEAWDQLADLATRTKAPRSLSLPGGLQAHYRRGVLTIERS